MKFFDKDISITATASENGYGRMAVLEDMIEKKNYNPHLQGSKVSTSSFAKLFQCSPGWQLFRVASFVLTCFGEIQT